MILTLALSPSVDVTYEVDAIAVGAITRPRVVTRVPGGKSLNVARVAHGLGAEVTVVAALGGSAGAWIASRLAEDGLAVTAVPLAAETRSCLAIVQTQSASPSSTDLYEPATPLTAGEWQDFASAVRATAAADWVVFSGSLPVGVPEPQLAALLAQLRGRGSRVAVDSSGAGLRALVGSADLVKVNRDEAGELLGSPVDSAAQACELLRSRFGMDCVVTDGLRGGAALTAAGPVIVPAPTARGRYPVGSGDAFFGGLISALDRGRSLTEALGVAADVAMRNALVPGPGILAS